MVEVFKTNVTDHLEASWLIKQIQSSFATYKANFDLDDCDRVLCIKSSGGPVQPEYVIIILKEFGYDAQTLPDDYPLQEGIAWTREICIV